MATTIGSLEFNVDADGNLLERQLRQIGRRAGATGGKQAASEFNRNFAKGTDQGLENFGSKFQQTMRKLEPSIQRFRNQFSKVGRTINEQERTIQRFSRSMDTALSQNGFLIDMDRANSYLLDLRKNTDNASLGFDEMGKSSGRNGRLLKSHVAKTIAAWTLLVLAIGEGTATLGSGVGATLTGMISSLALAIGGLASVAGVALVGAVAQLGLAVNSIRFLKDEVPGFTAALDGLGAAAEESGRRFASAWGPSLIGLFDELGKVISDSGIVDAMATSMANITDAFTEVLQSPGFQLFTEALRTTIPSAVENLGKGLANVFGGLMSFLAAAAPYAEEFFGKFNEWASGWNDRVTEMAGNGGFDEFFERAMRSIDSVIGVVTSLSAALGTVFNAGADSGNRMLDLLASLFDDWNAWMKTVEGQKALEEWFSNGERIFEGLLDLVGDLGKALGDLVTPESVERLLQFMDSLGAFLPMASQILQLFGQLNILNIFTEALNLIGAALTPIMPTLMEFATMLGETIVAALQNLQGPFENVFTAIKPVLDIISELAGAILPTLFDVIGMAVNFIGDLVTAISGGQAQSEEFADAIEIMGDVVKVIMEAVGNIVESVFDVVGGIFEATGKMLRGDFSGAWETMGGVVEDVLNNFGIDIEEAEKWVNDMWGVVEDILGNIGQFFSGIFEGDINKILGAFGLDIEDAENVLAAMSAFFDNMLQDIAGFFEDVFDNIVKGVLEMFGVDTKNAEKVLNVMKNEFKKILDGIGRFFDNIFGGIGDWFNALGGWISDAIGWFGSLIGASNNAQSAGNQVRSGGGSIRGYASGGILTGPQRILAGEAGPEAIVPLRRNLSQVDPSVRWMSAIMQGKTPAMASGGVVGGGRSVQVAPGAIVVQEAGNARRTANDVVTRLVEYAYS